MPATAEDRHRLEALRERASAARAGSLRRKSWPRRGATTVTATCCRRRSRRATPHTRSSTE